MSSRFTSSSSPSSTTVRRGTTMTWSPQLLRGSDAPEPSTTVIVVPVYFGPLAVVYPCPQASSQCIHSNHHQLQSVCNHDSSLNACPWCQRHPKHPEHRFCSVSCTRDAARSAPGLFPLPHHNGLFVDVAAQFSKQWKSASKPWLLDICMITWTEKSEGDFKRYRNKVEDRGCYKSQGLSVGNEQKRFRCAARACSLGENGNMFPCDSKQCELCETIRYGFEPHLIRKRNFPWNAEGIRLGAGIYTSHTSSKADKYAVNRHSPHSGVKAMFVCRVVIGKPYKTQREDPTLRSPPPGSDCVFGEPGWQSDFTDDEYVFYDPDAIRPAYLILYKTGA